MKITFVIASGFSMSGGDRVISIYAERLRKRGHDVFVVSRCRPRPRLKDQVKSLLRGDGLIPYRGHAHSHFDDVDVPRKVLSTFRSVRDRDVSDGDVVVATWWETAYWVHRLSPRKGKKIYFVQGHETFDSRRLEAVRASYRLPLHKIVNSRWLADVMGNEYGDRAVSYVPNSVDTSLFFAPPRAKSPIPTVGLQYSVPRLKGCDIALAAVALARERIPNLRLVALAMIDEVPELPLPAGTEFFRDPPQAQIREIYAKCDAWLFASRAEGFGLPILEAMACRTPVIGTPAGAAPELLADGNGVPVEADDPKDMARAIVDLCQLSPEEWHELSERAYKKVTDYTLDDAVIAFERALRSLEQAARASPVRTTRTVKEPLPLFPASTHSGTSPPRAVWSSSREPRAG